MGLKTILFGPPDEITVFENAGPLVGFVETKSDRSVILNQRQIEILKADNGNSLKGFEVTVLESQKKYLVNLSK